MASVAAEFVISMIYVHMSKGFISWKQIWQVAWKKMLAGLIMFLAVWMIGRGCSGSIVITVVQAACGAAIYGIILILLHDTFIKDALKMVIGRRKRN